MRIPSGVTDQVAICATCKEERAVSEFHKDSQQKHGRKYSCKHCVNGKRRGRYQKENRNYDLKSKYGISAEQFEEMEKAQGGVCAICLQRPERSGGKRAKKSNILFVDHDHITGEVRGLLCHKCNAALGLFGDDPMALERAADYIRGIPVEYLL